MTDGGKPEPTGEELQRIREEEARKAAEKQAAQEAKWKARDAERATKAAESKRRRDAERAQRSTEAAKRRMTEKLTLGRAEWNRRQHEARLEREAKGIFAAKRDPARKHRATARSRTPPEGLELLADIAERMGYAKSGILDAARAGKLKAVHKGYCYFSTEEWVKEYKEAVAARVHAPRGPKRKENEQ